MRMFSDARAGVGAFASANARSPSNSPAPAPAVCRMKSRLVPTAAPVRVLDVVERILGERANVRKRPGIECTNAFQELDGGDSISAARSRMHSLASAALRPRARRPAPRTWLDRPSRELRVRHRGAAD